MKKILFVLILFFAASCQRQHKEDKIGYKINGEIKNAPDSISVIISNEHFRDSTILINGKFSFSGITDAPRKIILTLEKASKRKIFWLENTQITIQGDYNEFEFAELSGGENQKILNVLANQKKPIRKLLNKYASQLENRSLDKFTKDSIANICRDLLKELEDIDEKFVKKNPNTLEGVIKLAVKRVQWNRDSVKTIFSKMNEEIRNTEHGIIISEYLKQPTNPDVGDSYIDVSLKNTNDEAIKLSQLTGTYTLIDFWASWCVPCREENPNLKELFKKYDDKGFNIIGVSKDRDKSKWLKAVEDDGLPWDNVNDVGDLLSNNIFILYDVRFIPDNLLLDQDGMIIGRNIRGDDLKDRLQILYGF